MLAPIPAWADAAGDIKTLQEAFIAAFRAKDLDAIMKFYAADEKLLVFDVVPPRQFVGAAAYREDWKEFLDTIDGPLTVEMTDFAVEADSNLAWGHSIQHVAGKMKFLNKI